MRRFLFGVVIASVATAMPTWAFGGDREIAKAVMAELQQHKAAGNLKGFDLDMQVEDGVVYLNGHVSSRTQRALVAQAAANAVGEDKLVNNIQVVSKSDSDSSESSRNAAKPASEPRAEALQTEMPMPLQDPMAVLPASGNRATTPAVSDSALTDRVIDCLQDLQNAGSLRGFELDVRTVNGDVWLDGYVSSQSQKDLVLDVARHLKGVTRIVDNIQVAAVASNHSSESSRNSQSNVRTASTGGLSPVPTAMAPAPIPQVPMPQSVVAQTPAPQYSSMPTGRPISMPQAFAPSGLASANVGGVPGGVVGGHPVAMQGTAYGVGAPRYDQPNMPAYAWPSYAAHPNYAAVTYPKQYSPSAWPYIGPFYPYPQVPLGWRKVALEWDDGLWYLDFTSK